MLEIQWGKILKSQKLRRGKSRTSFTPGGYIVVNEYFNYNIPICAALPHIQLWHSRTQNYLRGASGWWGGLNTGRQD